MSEATTAEARRTSILRAIKKSNALTASDALSLKKLYTKVPTVDPFKVRADVRYLVESGSLKKVSHEEDGVSVYLTASGKKELDLVKKSPKVSPVPSTETAVAS